MAASAYYSIGPAIRDYQRKHVSTLYLLVPFSKKKFAKKFAFSERSNLGEYLA